MQSPGQSHHLDRSAYSGCISHQHTRQTVSFIRCLAFSQIAFWFSIRNKLNSMRRTSRHHRSIGVLPRHVRMRTSRACDRQLIPVCLTLQFVKPVELQKRIDMTLRRCAVPAPKTNKVSIRVEFADDGVGGLQERFSVRTFLDTGFAVKGFVSIQAGQFIDLLKHDVLPPFLWCDFMFEFLYWALGFMGFRWCMVYAGYFAHVITEKENGTRHAGKEI